MLERLMSLLGGSPKKKEEPKTSQRGFERMSDGTALVNGVRYPASTQEDDPNLPNMGDMPMATSGRYEDDGFTGDPSNFNQFSPQNADIANYRQNAPFGNFPEQGVYNNITPYDSDAVMPGRMLQGAGQRRVTGMDANTQELLRRINSRNLRVQ